MENEVKNLDKKIREYENNYFTKNSLMNFIFVKRIIIGIIIVAILSLFINVNVFAFKINNIFGYIVLVITIILIIYFFIIPYSKLFLLKSFNFTKGNYKKTTRYNREVRKSMAYNIIDFSNKVESADWYDKEKVNELKIAINNNDDSKIREILSILVNTSIRKNSQSIIVNYSVKAGLYSAVSQSDKLDGILVLFNNMAMIKDLVFLFGFRPTIIKLVKIYYSIIASVAAAYGMQTSHIGSTIFTNIVKFFKPVAEVGAVGVATAINPIAGVPTGIATILINMISDSTFQGLANGGITACIGYQTIAYLNNEYNLQESLSNIDLLDDEKEFKDTCKEIEKNLKKTKK